MYGSIQQKKAVIELIADGDKEYRRCMEQYMQYEKIFLEMEIELEQEIRDAIWDYIMSCEAVSNRLLEIACEYVDFRGKTISL